MIETTNIFTPVMPEEVKQESKNSQPPYIDNLIPEDATMIEGEAFMSPMGKVNKYYNSLTPEEQAECEDRWTEAFINATSKRLTKEQESIINDRNNEYV